MKCRVYLAIHRIAFIALVMVTIACSSENASDFKLTYWSSNAAKEIVFAEQVISEWNADHPQQRVKFQPIPEGQSSEEIILAAVVGETTPDVYANMWQGDVELYANAKRLVPLDTLAGFMEFLYNRCDSAVIRDFTSLDGHIYQIPWKINPIMMTYNVDSVEAMGGVPITYSDYLSACATYKKDKNDDGYVDQWFGYREPKVIWFERLFDFYTLYIGASDGAPLIKDGKAAFNNEHGLAVFTFLQKLYTNNYFTKERLTSGEDPFFTGAIATKFTGPWEIEHNEHFKPEGFRYHYSPVPVPDAHTGPVFTYGDPKNIVIFSTCKDPGLAWDFIKELISPANDLRLLKLSNQIPNRKDLTVNPLFTSEFESNPKMIPFSKQAGYIKGVDNHPVIKEVFDIISQEYEACVIYGMKTPEMALDDAERAVNVLFANM